MALINPELIKIARFALREGWAPAGSIEKTAIVPPGGGDPSGGGGGPPPGGAGGPPPGAGGPPPGPDPSLGSGPPPGAAAPGDPAGGAAGGPPPGPMDPQSLQQIVAAVQQAMGGAGGPGGKGKSPKDQLQAAKDKIQIHLLAQIASKLGVQVDPQLLVPPADPAGEQMAMQEMQTAPMMPGGDPNAQGGAPPGGGDPSGGAGGGDPSGGGGAGPGPVAPLDAGQGPIGKAAGARPGRLALLALDDEEGSIGQEYTVPRLRANRVKAAARVQLLRSLGRPG